jgi:hypothetical protein
MTMPTLSRLAALVVLCLSLVGAAPPVAADFGLAGTYFRGRGLGFNNTLEIAKDGTFHFRWTGCLGTYAESTGTVSRQGNELVLEAVVRGRREVSRYVAIRWGGRQYLVSADELKSFAAEIDRGGEPRGGPLGSFYLRKEDWTLPGSGRPDLPPS